MEAEAQRELLEALQIQTRPLDAPEVGEEAQTPPEVRPESRPDPILPVAVSVREHLARKAGRLAFGGIVDLDQDLPADGQLPLLPAPEGPRVPPARARGPLRRPHHGPGPRRALGTGRLHRRVHPDAPPCPGEPREARYDRPRAP